MQTIVELVSEIASSKSDLEEAKKSADMLTKRIKRLESELKGRPSIDPSVELLATHVIYVQGDWGGALSGDGGSQIDSAINDLTNGCKKLKHDYIGIKAYDRWHAQGTNHPYGMTSRHGRVYAQIGLTKEARTRDLTDEEVSAAVQYLLALKNHLTEARNAA